MTDAWTPLCLVAACDVGEVAWPLPVVLVAEDLTLTLEGAPQLAPDILPRVALAVSRSAKGAALLDRLPGPLRLDLSPNQDLQAALAGALAQSLSLSQRRVAAQARELSQMRAMTERSLQNFARLEAFVWQSVKAERQLVTSLPVRLEEPGLPLTAPVEQRLPGGSAGLSDIGLCIAEAGEGVLTATLVLHDSTEVVARWQVQDPGIGWLRLALPRALGSDGQAALLRLDWTGAALELCRSHAHPDPRYRCQGGPMLALRTWSFIPGTQAQMAPGSIAPLAAPPGGRWLLGAQALAELSPGAQGGASLAPDLALPLPAGTRRIRAHVEAEGQAEFRLSAGDQAHDQWITGRDQLHLFLAEPAGGTLTVTLLSGGQAVLTAVEFLGDAEA